ncbi:hypothetical protein, partial [Erythrobacter sp. YJ-T3-07]|uniref:hypothetical protein n=1 Tax=Erythrobacter sp. YJ-T3-07 TaxID=2793063 RepID=UPI001F46457B
GRTLDSLGASMIDTTLAIDRAQQATMDGHRALDQKFVSLGADLALAQANASNILQQTQVSHLILEKIETKLADQTLFLKSALGPRDANSTSYMQVQSRANWGAQGACRERRSWKSCSLITI